MKKEVILTLDKCHHDNKKSAHNTKENNFGLFTKIRNEAQQKRGLSLYLAEVFKLKNFECVDGAVKITEC